MKSMWLPAIAISAVLGFVACSDDNGTGAEPNNNPLSETDPYGYNIPGNTIPGSEISGTEVSGTEIPGTETPGNQIPETQVPGSEIPSETLPGGEIPGGDLPGDVSSSSTLLPGGDVPAFSSSSMGGTNPGGQGGNTEPGDDENDNEDNRTLNGTQILLKLAGTSATVENNNGCVDVADKSATITCPGAYYVTGEASDFQVVVNTPAADKEGNTGIYLYNATIKSSNSPLLIKNADKAVIHLVKGTTNVLEDGNGNHAFTNVGGKQDTSKAVIYSKDDMNIKGAGKLTVTAKFMNGIQSTNDLKIKNGDITVTAPENGIKGKGSLHISGGTLNITAQKGDGLESNECVENNDGSFKDTVATKGIVKITGGNITIKAGDDGIDAANYILVNDSTEEAKIKVTATSKGLVAEKFIYVDGGTLDVTSDNDALHTHWQIYMNGGNVTVNAKDDGVHADSALYLKGSTVNVVTAKEGIEAYRIFAENGVTSVFATDDGWNAAGGPKDPNSQMAMFGESSGHIVISGGYHYISTKGNMVDGLDANGTAKMTGGVLIVEFTGQTYDSQGGMGGFGGGWGMPGMGGQGGNNCGAYNFPGGLIDTDDGFTITGGVLLAFGNYSMDVPGCAEVTFNNSSYYGSNNAAFKPSYQGNYILYGGDVKSVAQVQTSGMKEFKFPNGVSYMYK